MSAKERGTSEASKTLPSVSTLLVGSPSPDGSKHPVSMREWVSSNNQNPLTGQKSSLGDRLGSECRVDNVFLSSDESIEGPLSRRQTQEKTAGPQQSKAIIDAKWAEMQSQLQQVELSAAAGTHVFGIRHSKALEELRTAQIALAQAWARNSGNEEQEQSLGKAKQSVQKQKQKQKEISADLLVSDKGDSQRSRDRSDTNTSAQSRQLAEETESDIAMARQRRLANDEYFGNVNAGVKNVVAKLEEVARAMKRVEMESKGIWREQDSTDEGTGT